MKKLLFILIVLIASCATSNVKKVVTEDANLEDAENIVVVIRISETSRITPKEYSDSIQTWMAGYDTNKRVTIVHEIEGLSKYTNNNERFYQVSANKDFLKYKSLGVIRTFIAKNRTEIQNTMRMNASDYLIFYEIGGAYSPSLKAIKYNSVVAVINREEEIVYLDHQNTYVGDGDFDRDDMKKEFIDKTTLRLYATLKDINIITE